jgi:U3 small nucleolar RNA-associated protein 13
LQLQSSSDGRRFVCEYEGNIKILDVNDVGNAPNFFDDSVPHEPVATFCVHPNWKEIVLATTKFSIALWTIEDKKCLKTIKAHRMPILCMDYDQTGTLVVTGSADKHVRVWDIKKGYCTHSFTDHHDIVKSVYFHSDPKQLLLFSTSDDNTVCLFDLKKQKLVSRFTDHSSLPTRVALSSDGSILISCGRDKVRE